MAAIEIPQIDPDGTHVIPIAGIYRPQETPNDDATGEIRWSRRDGLTFWFQAPLKSFSLFAGKQIAPTSGAGSVKAVSFEPEWIAQTADGGAVRLYSTSSNTTTRVTSGWNIAEGDSSGSSRRVEGTACYADVDLHSDNPVTFWHDTPRSHRLFSPGWELRGWPLHENIEFAIAGSVHKRTRCSLPFSGPCDRQLIAASSQPTGLRGVWLTYQPDESTGPFWFPESCDHIRGVLSILSGQHVPFVWRDTPLSDDRLNRLYFGWFRGVDLGHPRFQLVPLFGTVESLTHEGRCRTPC